MREVRGRKITESFKLKIGDRGVEGATEGLFLFFDHDSF